MLKIKKEIDLKELANFGFHYDCDWEMWVWQDDSRFSMQEIKIDEDRQIDTYKFFDEAQDVLFDLIQAGLVEKVEV